MITQREDGSTYVNLTTTVFFNWWSRDRDAYTLMVTIYGNTLAGAPMPPSSFDFFTLYWKLD